MSFGRRTAVSPPALRGGPLRPAARVAARPTPSKTRRGGYPAALAAAALGFVISIVLVDAWAFAHTQTTPYTPLGIFLYALVGVGPFALINYAIVLAIAAILLRTLRVGGPVAHALVCLLLSLPVVVTPFLMPQSGRGLGFIAAFILPGAVVGGLVLGAFRPNGVAREASVS